MKYLLSRLFIIKEKISIYREYDDYQNEKEKGKGF
jgi:hypothetical protein